MDFDDYLRLPGVNWSTLKHMRTSPLHYRHAAESDADTDTAALRKGRGFHALVLEPDVFDREYKVWSGRRQGRAWNDFAAEHHGKTILTSTEYAKCTGMAASVLSHPVAAQMLEIGVREHVLQWTDAETGIACKGRIDHGGSRLIDLKSTAVIEPRRFATHAARMGYVEQLAWYSDGCAASGIRLEADPALIVVQSEPPFDVVVYEVAEYLVEHGRSEYRRLLRQLKQCRDTNEWPGVSGGETQQLVLPEWAFASDDDDVTITIGGEEVRI